MGVTATEALQLAEDRPSGGRSQRREVSAERYKRHDDDDEPRFQLLINCTVTVHMIITLFNKKKTIF